MLIYSCDDVVKPALLTSRPTTQREKTIAQPARITGPTDIGLPTAEGYRTQHCRPQAAEISMTLDFRYSQWSFG